MTLAIANSTRQHLEFHYREPVNNLLQKLSIGSGRQVVVGHDWNPEQQRLVIRQLETFGARNAAELKHATADAFHGLSYRDDNPVTEEQILAGHEAVLDAQEDRSVRQATRAALGFDRAVRRPAGGRQTRARTTEVEVVQELPPYERPTGHEVAMKLTIDPEGRRDVDLPV